MWATLYIANNIISASRLPHNRIIIYHCLLISLDNIGVYHIVRTYRARGVQLSEQLELQVIIILIIIVVHNMD